MLDNIGMHSATVKKISTALRYWRQPTKDNIVKVVINNVVHRIKKRRKKISSKWER